MDDTTPEFAPLAQRSSEIIEQLRHMNAICELKTSDRLAGALTDLILDGARLRVS